MIAALPATIVSTIVVRESAAAHEEDAAADGGRIAADRARGERQACRRSYTPPPSLAELPLIVQSVSVAVP